eukprot:CAMPEP_0170555958 /NCGR_PEP_ID=MMETSP0211-20121228/14861_1 /TAXON_ID=311385 /ORGANISM="Pseudokeronopsis sp., Strain OXSARD2" /LENGTH=45 /DNA_ID= /DNA_START= /DNA_END= /DNA_ORIENTATION=
MAKDPALEARGGEVAPWKVAKSMFTLVEGNTMKELNGPMMYQPPV